MAEIVRIWWIRVWIHGGSEGDPGLKLVDPTEMSTKMNGKNGGSNETTHPLYIINEEHENVKRLLGLI